VPGGKRGEERGKDEEDPGSPLETRDTGATAGDHKKLDP